MVKSKLIAGLLSIALLIPTPVLGADTYVRTNADTGSYIKTSAVSGSSSKLHMIYSETGTSEEVEGLFYDEKTNTLTVDSFTGDDIILTVNDMGDDFAIDLKGENVLRSINVSRDEKTSGLTVKGNGAVTLGYDRDHLNVPLNLIGDLSVESGKMVLIGENKDQSTGLGLRFSIYIKGDSAIPLSTAVSFDGTLTRKTTDEGNVILSCKDTVTFEGAAIEAPKVKRKSKRLVKCKPIEGCTYQALIGGEIIDMDQPMIKTKKKVSIRAVKKEEGSIIYSPWSKEV